MPEQHALHLPEGCDGDPVQHVVGIVEQDLGDRDQGRVEFPPAQPLRQFGGSHELDLVFETAREGHRVQVGNRADPVRGERLIQLILLLPKARPLLPLDAMGEVLGDWVRRGDWSAEDAVTMVDLVARENAERVYRL